MQTSGPNSGSQVERVYFDTSALHHFLKLDYSVFLGTRDLQKLRGRELFVSPMTLWELMLTPDEGAADFLLFSAQHLFSPRLLATPGELLFRYVEHAYPDNRTNYDIFTDLPVGDIWAKMTRDPGVKMLWNVEALRARSAFVRRLSTNLSGIVHYPKRPIADPYVGILAGVVKEVLDEGRLNGVLPGFDNEDYDLDILHSLILLLIILLVIFKLDFLPDPVDDYWEDSKIPESDVLTRLLHFLESYPVLFRRGPLCEMAVMAYHQLSTGRTNRGTLFDAMHLVYAPYVHTILSGDEDFRSLRDLEERYKRKIRHVDEINLRPTLFAWPDQDLSGAPDQ